MRAIFILSILKVLILSGCATIEVAKEINKATNSIKTSIQNIASNKEEPEKEISVEENKEKENKKELEELKEEILLEKNVIIIEKKKEKTVVLKQNKITANSFVGKTLKEITQNLGKPKLLREDGKTITARFDTKSCRVFVYFNRSIKKSRVEHYELRNAFGELIEKQTDIKKCFEEIKLA